MKIAVDADLSPKWVQELTRHGFEAVHWGEVGELNALDPVVMAWAREHDHVVFTHDLGFGAILSLTRARGPSVVQLRAQDVMPEAMGPTMVAVFTEYRAVLEAGAIISVDQTAARVRVLPIR